ncbi:MAG: GNAT family N-acetyltransferase, partial [bacterium]|nr:GNAT family N-acetyltransferase [bacterium]
MNDATETIVKRTEELTPEETGILDVWSRDLFGEAELEHEWAAPDWRVLIYADGRLASHVAICERAATASVSPVTLGGIGGVMTPHEFQGKGLAKFAMRASQAFMRDKLGVEFGLLLCSERLVRYYARLGWVHVTGPLVYAQSSGNETWNEQQMVMPFTSRSWPEGE